MLNDRLLEVGYFKRITAKIHLSLAGLSMAVISRDSYTLERVRERYRHFKASGPAEYEIVVQFLTGEAPPPPDVGTMALPVIKRVNSGYNYLIQIPESPFLAVANTVSRKVLVKMPASAEFFDCFLPALIRLILAEEGSLILHASQVVAEGRAHVFFSAADRSKKDHHPTELYAPAADRFVIIKPHNGRFRTYNIFLSRASRQDHNAERSELAAVYLVKKDLKTDITLSDQAPVLLSLYRNASLGIGDGRLLNHIMDTCCRIGEKVPLYELRVRHDPFPDLGIERRMSLQPSA